MMPVLLLIILSGCEKELDFKYSDIEPLPVIEAWLTPEGSRVAITLTTPMNEPIDRKLLTDATVILSDLTSGDEMTLFPDGEGYYVNTTPGIVGHDYRLHVERDAASYEAEATMLPPVEIKNLEFAWVKMPYDYVAAFQTQYTDDQPTLDQCYWLRLYRNGDIYMWTEQDDRGADDGILTFTTLTTRQDIEAEDDSDLILDGDTITLNICPISRSMYTYLQMLANDNSGPAMFSGPRCLGFFLATTPATDSIIFNTASISVK